MTLEELTAVNIYLSFYNDGQCPERGMEMEGLGKEYATAKKIMDKAYPKD